MLDLLSSIALTEFDLTMISRTRCVSQYFKKIVQNRWLYFLEEYQIKIVMQDIIITNLHTSSGTTHNSSVSFCTVPKDDMKRIKQMFIDELESRIVVILILIVY
jgi:hypothetical protein